jgi:hypothetical protein
MGWFDINVFITGKDFKKKKYLNIPSPLYTLDKVSQIKLK